MFCHNAISLLSVAQSHVPTIIQSPLQDGWRTGTSIPNPCESQNLYLIEHIFP